MSILDGNLISNLSDKGIRSTLYIQSDLAEHAFLSLWRKGTFVQNQDSVLDNLESCYILKPGKSPFLFYFGNMLAVILVCCFFRREKKKKTERDRRRKREESKALRFTRNSFLKNRLFLKVIFLPHCCKEYWKRNRMTKTIILSIFTLYLCNSIIVLLY